MRRGLSRHAVPLVAMLNLALPRAFHSPPAATADTLLRPGQAGRTPSVGPGARLPTDEPLPAGPSLAPAILIRTPRLAAGPEDPSKGCSSQVDGTDPLAVAAAVAAWVFCGAGPATALSRHGGQVLLGWSAVEFPTRPATVTSVALPDPRAKPVVAYAVVRRAADRLAHRVVLTLYRSSSGQWTVDDLIVVDR